MGKKKRSKKNKNQKAPKYVQKAPPAIDWKGILKTIAETAWFLLIPLSFYLVERFAFRFLYLQEGQAEELRQWPLEFGVLWAVILGGLIRMIPAKAARIVYGFVYFFAAVYAGFQTGYYILFSEMMWLSDFRYASEGADYASVLLSCRLVAGDPGYDRDGSSSAVEIPQVEAELGLRCDRRRSGGRRGQQCP